MKKIRLVLVSLLCIALFSCSEESYDPNPGEKDLVWVKSVRMVIEGDVYYGKMNENAKQIHFPMLDKGLDLSNVRFRGNFPDDNAHFEHETYDFTMEEGNPQITKIIKVINNKRFREYRVTLRLKLPPPGADFTKMKVYNFGSGGTKYPDFGSTATRIADMDLEHVLVVGRNNTGGVTNKPHLLRLADLKEGNFNPIDLNLEGATGGTYMYNNGRLINGHAYVTNLSTSFDQTGVYKLYHWSTARPEEPPVVVANYIGADTEGDIFTRYGDMLSLDLNARGSGYLYAKSGNGPAGRQPGLLRIRIENYVNASAPTGFIVKNATGVNIDLGYFATYTPVEGVADEFMYAGDQGATYLVDGSGKLIYQMTTFGNADGQAARIISFNGVPYLLTMNGPLAGGVIAMYQLDSKAESVKEALETFDKADASDKVNLLTPVVSIGSATSGEHVVSIGYAKNDDVLYIIGSGVGAGFAIIELPKPAEPDPGDDSDEFFDALDELGYI